MDNIDQYQVVNTSSQLIQDIIDQESDLSGTDSDAAL